MSIVWLLIYVAVAVWLIWWVLREAKKLDVGHGDHAHDQSHTEQWADPPPGVDDLTRIKGIGAVIAARLRKLGISSYAQVAGLSDTEIEKINAELNFKGRVEREQWIQQAQEILSNEH
jgi:large subunit ribosomal protein L21